MSIVVMTREGYTMHSDARHKEHQILSGQHPKGLILKQNQQNTSKDSFTLSKKVPSL